MTQTSRIIRAVRKTGTNTTTLTVGNFQTQLTRWEALNLLRDLFLAVWGGDFNSEVLRRR